MLKRKFYFKDIEITSREIIASIIIIAVMIVIGLFITENITEKTEDNNSQYNKAIQINNNTDLFTHGINTNVGNAFIYGTLEAINSVTDAAIDGEYMSITTDIEHYTGHTRQVAHTRTDGKGHTSTYYTTEVYYTWDSVGGKTIHVEKLKFCGVEFDYNKIDVPVSDYNTTIYQSSSDRTKYYTKATEYTGTIYTELKDGTIKDNSKFFENSTTEEAHQQLIKSGTFWIVIFWIVWIFLIIALVFTFYKAANNWLDD